MPKVHTPKFVTMKNVTKPLQPTDDDDPPQRQGQFEVGDVIKLNEGPPHYAFMLPGSAQPNGEAWAEESIWKFMYTAQKGTPAADDPPTWNINDLHTVRQLAMRQFGQTWYLFARLNDESMKYGWVILRSASQWSASKVLSSHKDVGSSSQ